MTTCEARSGRPRAPNLDGQLALARPVRMESIMPKPPLLTILSLAALALAGCAEKDPPPAKTAAHAAGGATSGGGDRAAEPSTRNKNLPPMPRRVGGGAADPTDQPGDGERPSHEEMMARRDAKRQEMLDKFDADHDGKLSDTERTAAHQARTGEMMTRMDADKNGKLSKAELEDNPMRGRRGAGDLFDRLDVDKDGFVSSAELEQAGPRRGFRAGGPDGPGQPGRADDDLGPPPE